MPKPAPRKRGCVRPEPRKIAIFRGGDDASSWFLIVVSWRSARSTGLPAIFLMPFAVIWLVWRTDRLGKQIVACMHVIQLEIARNDPERTDELRAEWKRNSKKEWGRSKEDQEQLSRAIETATRAGKIDEARELQKTKEQFARSDRQLRVIGWVLAILFGLLVIYFWNPRW
jgi:hypothetical protein